MQPPFAVAASRLDEVGGYRVVRMLSAGRLGLTLLAHGDGQSWAARVFHRECPAEIINREVAVSDAVLSASGVLPDHVSVVKDLCTTDDGRVVLLSEYLAGPRLDVLLRDRHGTVELGEAVTLLAPLVAAVDQAHGLGVTGLVNDAAGVRFRLSGAPVVTRRHAASLGPALPERFRDRDARYPADRAALERLGMTVASAVPGDDQAALMAAVRRPRGAVELALFDLADPVPVRLAGASRNSEHLATRGSEAHRSATQLTQTRRASTLHSESAAEATRPQAAEVSQSQSQSQPLPQAVGVLLTALSSLGLPEAVVTPVREITTRAADTLRGAATAVRRAVRLPAGSVRPRFVIIGVTGVASLVLALSVAGLAVVPSAAPEPAQEATRAGSESSAPSMTLGPPETELHPEPDTWRAIVDELVKRWLECAPESGAPATGGCATDVVHADSAAATLIASNDPRHALLAEWRSDGGDVVVVERMGAAVLIDLVSAETATASLLIVRSEAGWRVRDVIG